LPEPLTLVTLMPLRLPVVVRAKSLASTPVTGSENVTVKRTLAALVGFGSARVIETTVGAVSPSLL